MVRRLPRPAVLGGLAALAALALIPPLPAQAPNQEHRQRAQRILEQGLKDLEENFWDSTFGGVDLRARYATTRASLDTQPTIQQLFGAISQFFFDLHDSHTVFHPPARAARVEYGWSWRVVGNRCYVASVMKGSDAEQKGLALGDEVLSIDGIPAARQNRYLIPYLYYSLSPRPGMRVTVKKPEGTPQDLDVMARVSPEQRVMDYGDFQHVGRLIEEYEQARAVRRHRWRSFGDTALVWTFPSFASGDERAIDGLMDRARRHKTLILDLRDNGGGAVTTMLRLIGHFFDRDTRVATIHHRTRVDTLVAEPARKTPFAGTTIILIDAYSASASEITARTLQLEGKATLVGDRSAGAVMGSRLFERDLGHDKRLEYRFQITVWDAVMADGTRLENTGVEPEFYVLPTGSDLAARRDPQMAKALALAGITMTPEEAGKLYGRQPGS